MAHYDAELAAPPPIERRRWPLALVVWLDLVIIVGLVVLSSFVVQTAVLSINARVQGLSAADLQAMSSTERIGLLGVRGAFISTVLQNLFCVVVPLARIALIRREPIATIGWSTRRWPINIAIGVGVGFLAITISYVLSIVFFQFGIRQNQSAEFGALLRPGDVVGQALFAVMTILVAPIGEEALFRGYIFHALEQGGGTWRMVSAYLISAGLFASVHLLNVTQGQIALILPIFIVGLLLAATVHQTKSLLPAIIAHAIFNSLGTLALLFCINTRFPGCPI